MRKPLLGFPTMTMKIGLDADGTYAPKDMLRLIQHLERRVRCGHRRRL